MRTALRNTGEDLSSTHHFYPDLREWVRPSSPPETPRGEHAGCTPVRPPCASVPLDGHDHRHLHRTSEETEARRGSTICLVPYGRGASGSRRGLLGQRRLPFTAAWKKGRGEIGTGEHPHPGTGASEHKRTWPWFLASGQIGGAGEGLGAGEVGNARTVNCARATSKVQEDPHPVCFPHGPHLNPAADPRTPKRGLSETGAVDSTPAHSPAAKELPLTPSVTRGSSHGTLTLHTSRSTRHPVEARAEKIPHSLIPLYVSKGENSHVHEPQR